MTALDYLLVLELLMLFCAGVLWAIGEIFGRIDPDDELCQVMRSFWQDFNRSRILGPAMAMFRPRLVSVEESQQLFSKHRRKESQPAVPETARSTATNLAIKVVPGSSRDEIAGKLGDAVKIKVMAAPEGGQANRAVIDLLAEALELPTYRIKLLRGHYDSRKLIQISGMSQAELDEKLAKFF